MFFVLLFFLSMQTLEFRFRIDKNNDFKFRQVCYVSLRESKSATFQFDIIFIKEEVQNNSAGRDINDIYFFKYSIHVYNGVDNGVDGRS